MTLRQKILILSMVPLGLAALVWIASIEPLRSASQEAERVAEMARSLDQLDALSAALRAERAQSMRAIDGHRSEELSAVVAATDNLIKQLQASVTTGMARAPGAEWTQLQALLVKLNELDQIRGTLPTLDSALAISRAYRSSVAAVSDTLEGTAVSIESPILTALVRERASVIHLSNSLNLLVELIAIGLQDQAVSPALGIALAEEASGVRLALGQSERLASNPAAANTFSVQMAEGAVWSLVNSALDGVAIREEVARLAIILGYGGAIHQFKNTVLRADSRAADQARSSLQDAQRPLAQLRQLLLSDPVRTAQLAEIEKVVSAYTSALERIQGLHRDGASVTRIDQRVKIDDEQAVLALSALLAWDANTDVMAWRRVGQGLQQSLSARSQQIGQNLTITSQEAATTAKRTLLFYIALLMGFLTIVLFLTTSTYLRLSRSLSTFLGQLRQVVETGDLRAEITVSGRDELGQIQEMVAAINDRLLVLADIAEQHAKGNVGLLANPLGNSDQLALALRSLGESQRDVTEQAQRIADGDYDLSVTARSEADTMAAALAAMNQALRDFRTDVDEARYASEGQLTVLESMRSPKDLTGLCTDLLVTLTEFCESQIAAIYVLRGEQLELAGQVGLSQETDISARLNPETGQFSRALKGHSTLILNDLSADYFPINSALGSTGSTAVTATPLYSSGSVIGVMELGWLSMPQKKAIKLLDALGESIAMAVDAVLSKSRTEDLLQETRSLASKLESQQEELRASNEELEEQTQALRQSEEELKMQREELQTSNEELEEKSEALEAQRRQLQQVADDLAQATKYKSEFLANMSHELRTPLNSMLILTQQLADNEDENLSNDQVEAARVVNDSGRDLLALINEILDLAKVEAGQLTVHPESVAVDEVAEGLRRQFSAQAESKQLSLRVARDEGVADHLYTDRQRLQQILRNLLSNALKFTSQGEVILGISSYTEDLPRPSAEDGKLIDENALIAFSVRDTGMGIAQERLEEMFQPFTQADGSTSRHFGGTGLGLSICREMANLLSGRISVVSEVGKGSCFTLVLPSHIETTQNEEPAIQGNRDNLSNQQLPPAATPNPAPTPVTIDDDREAITPPDDGILIIEDDARFATVVRDHVRRSGLHALVALDGSSGLTLARQYQPHGIILDLRLPDMDGSQLLDALKQDLQTRHIPVHVVSASDQRLSSLHHGAVGFLGKPISAEGLATVLQSIDSVHAKRKKILVVEDDLGTQTALRQLLSSDDADIETLAEGKPALQRIREGDFDCIVLDLRLPDIDGFEFLRRLTQEQGEDHPPVVVYTGRELNRDEHRELSQMAQSIVVKGADSPERLIDEVTLFVHALKEKLPESQQQVLERLHDSETLFKDKHLLIVDDDLRNTFALSAALKKYGFKIEIADNGQMALDKLDEQPDTDLVLMDIMMPVMDGYEAMTALRKDARFENLPVIALTAKAMPEDRRKCIDAGASDYLAKPIDMDRLLAVMRVWLARAK